LKLLLDTHALLWFALSDKQLTDAAGALIMDPRNEVLVSIASYWEIAIKVGLKKYVLSRPYEEFMADVVEKNGFFRLQIEPRHLAVLTDLPFHHRDPFDRLIVAQAIVEQIPILSSDRALDLYPIQRRW